MISLDQVLLLQKKVESAVEKIQQLQAENDALRSKCTELTNALSRKSEQLNTFQSDQNQIESGILRALDRLNQIENSVINSARNSTNPKTTPVAQVLNTNLNSNPNIVTNRQVVTSENNTTPVNPVVQPVTPVVNAAASQPQTQQTPQIVEQPVVDFNSMNYVPSENQEAAPEENYEADASEEDSDGMENGELGFDIF